jgi:glucokinase
MPAARRVPYPVLLGDIGGTNARFAVLEGPGRLRIPLPRALTADFPTPVGAIRQVLSGYPGSPRSAVLALATRVEGPVARLTNAAWTLDAAEVGRAFDLDVVWLVNDYVPVAAALPSLDEGAGDLTRIGPDTAVDKGSRVVLGAGTGLGAAAVIPAEDRWLVQPTEAGHIDFGPATEDEMTLWPHLTRIGGRVSAEAVLSGPGLLRLYEAVARLRGLPAHCAEPGDVAAASARGDALANDVLHLFARLLGRYAGDLALIFEPSAVYIGGGIAPQILPVLREGGFRAAFESKSFFRDWMRSLPTFVLTDPDPALRGLCTIVADPERFLFRSAVWNNGDPS